MADPDKKAPGAQLAAKPAQANAKPASAPAQADLTTTKPSETHEGVSAVDQRAVSDTFAGLQGQFMNAVDELGDTHALRMAKSHMAQAQAWIHLHLHPDPSTTMPDAPPPPPPNAA